MGFIKAVTISDSITADMVLEALKSNDIPCYKKDLGLGNYKRISSGYSNYGSEIYVEDTCIESAKDIIGSIYGNNEESFDDELVKGNEKFNLRRRIFLYVCLTIVVASVAMIIAVSL